MNEVAVIEKEQLEYMLYDDEMPLSLDVSLIDCFRRKYPDIDEKGVKQVWYGETDEDGYKVLEEVFDCNFVIERVPGMIGYPWMLRIIEGEQ